MPRTILTLSHFIPIYLITEIIFFSSHGSCQLNPFLLYSKDHFAYFSSLLSWEQRMHLPSAFLLFSFPAETKPNPKTLVRNTFCCLSAPLLSICRAAQSQDRAGRNLQATFLHLEISILRNAYKNLDWLTFICPRMSKLHLKSLLLFNATSRKHWRDTELRPHSKIPKGY